MKKSRSSRKKVIPSDPSSDEESEDYSDASISFPKVPQKKIVTTQHDKQSENADRFVTPKSSVRSMLPSCASTSSNGEGKIVQRETDCCTCCCKFDYFFF